MRVSKPSPAMVVALVALAFAMTGTAISATGAFVITSGKQIKPGAITAANIKDGSITSAKLANGAVTSPKLAANAVTTTKIRKDAVTETRIASGAVSGRGLGAGVVASANLAPGSVTGPALAPSAVGSANIAPGAITSSAIAPDAVTSTNIAAGAVTSRGIAALCANGSIAVGGNCEISQVSYSSAATMPSIPGGVPFQIGAGITGNPTAVGALEDVSEVMPGTVTSTAGFHFADAVVTIRGAVPAQLTNVTAELFVFGVPTGSVNSCSFNPQTQTSCTIAPRSSATSVFAQNGARVAWRFSFVGSGVAMMPAFTISTAFVGTYQCAVGQTCG